MIKLRLLGEIQLRATPPDGAEVDALLRQSKRLALLAYLASPAPGTWHRRDVLLALFWPELDTAHARTSLRNALHVLRRTLGDAILRTRGDEEVSIDPALVQSDLADVWAALRADRPEDAMAHYGRRTVDWPLPARQRRIHPLARHRAHAAQGRAIERGGRTSE
jgi:DNA-binding SARP family transcriptional activator